MSCKKTCRKIDNIICMENLNFIISSKRSKLSRNIMKLSTNFQKIKGASIAYDIMMLKL